MKPTLDVAALCRQWVHSKEEDTSTETVYRPADFAFPPSRGRRALVFNADGTFKRIGIGPTDISAVTEGTWKIADPDTGHIQVDINNARETLPVRSLERDRLTISKGP